MSFVTTAAVVGIAGTAAGTYKTLTADKPQAPAARNIGNELQSIIAQYPELAGMLTGGQSFSGSALSGVNELQRGSFDPQAYLQARPDIRANWDSDPGYAQMYGSLENYAKADWEGQGSNPQFLGPGISDASAGLNTANRTANIQDVQNLAGDYSQIIRQSNPELFSQLQTFMGAANAPVQQSAAQQQYAQLASQGMPMFDASGLMASSPTGSPLLESLNQRALAQSGPGQLQQQQNEIAQQLLANGGNLSASDLRNVQQASRAGFAARGLGGANASVVDEVLQTDAARRQRLMENLGLAQGVQNQGMAEQNLQQQFGLGVSGQNLGYGNLGLATQQANQNFGLGAYNANLSNRGQQLDALGNAAGLAEQQRQSQLAAQQAAFQAANQARLDPWSAIIGGSQDNLGALLGLSGQAAGQQSNVLSSLLGYGQDVNSTNYNANAAANIAGYNQNQQQNSALLGLGGNLLGSYLKNPNTGPGWNPFD